MIDNLFRSLVLCALILSITGVVLSATKSDTNFEIQKNLKGILGSSDGNLFQVTPAENQFNVDTTSSSVTLSLSDTCVFPGTVTINDTFTIGSETGIMSFVDGVVQSTQVEAPVVFDSTSGVVSFNYDTTNLKVTSSNLNTVQDIATTSSPTFNVMTVTSSRILAGTTNTAYGQAVLEAVTTGYDLTAVGKNALKSNTTGFENTAIGSGAMQSNVSGLRNIAIGVGAMASSTQSSSNVVIGKDALTTALNTGGNIAIGDRALRFFSGLLGGNTAVGNTAMQSAIDCDVCCAFGDSSLGNNSGNHNNGFGGSTLQQNTSGVDNCAFGYESSVTNSTGNGNVAVGNYSLKANTVSNNTAMGYYALTANSTGTRNCAVGASALRTNTTASDQTAVGSSALYNATGQQNTAIGSNAGLGITTGTANVLIGYNAGSALTTQSGQLYIANTNTSTPLLQGDFSAKTLTINDTLTAGVGFKVTSSGTTMTRYLASTESASYSVNAGATTGSMTITYTIINNLCTVQIPSVTFTGTNTATTFNITISDFTPSATSYSFAYQTLSGAFSNGRITVSVSNPKIVISPVNSSAVAVNWNGSCEVLPTSISFLIS